jgi:hypothetical protein
MKRVGGDWIAPFVVAALLLTLLAILLGPHALLRATTPTGGDTAAHIYTSQYLREMLIPEGRLAGWSQGWFGGFPIMHFYFPLVFVVQAALSTILASEIAFKLGMILPILLFPGAVWLCFRFLRYPEPIPTFGSVAAGGFLLMGNSDVTGGNILSTMHGEFSFALGICFFVLLIGLGYRISVDEHPPLVAATLATAGLGLSHLLPLVVLLVLSPLLVMSCARKFGFLESAKRFAIVFGSAFCLGAFWFVPFVSRLSAAPRIRPLHLEGWVNAFPDELDLFLVLAACAAGVAVLRRDMRFLYLAVPGIAGLVMYAILKTDFFWNARLLPFWYVAVFLGSGYFAGTAVTWVSDRFAGRGLLIRNLIILSVALGSIGGLAVTKQERVTTHVNRALGGFEAAPGYKDFEELMGKIGALPSGRFLTEWSKDLAEEVGSHHAMMSIPYWTKQSTIEGLYFESSLAFPGVFLTKSEASVSPPELNTSITPEAFDLSSAVRHMKILGVSYYLTTSQEGRERARSSAELESVASAGRYSVFSLEERPLVEKSRYMPMVWTGPDWQSVSLEWFNRYPEWRFPLVDEGPSEWPRLSSLEADLVGERTSDRGQPSDVSLSANRIEFRTPAVGTPHVVRVSYFPNWRAEGAIGPYLAAPSVMVVIPTRKHVRLVYERSLIEWLGIALSVWSIACLLIYTVIRGNSPGGRGGSRLGTQARR